MSHRVLASFLHACGGSGPLEIVVDRSGAEAVAPLRMDQPCLRIGRHPRSDLRLDDPAVSQRHAYLQLIAGRLLCIDLESRTGTLHRGEPVSFTWLDPLDTLQIGPYRLTVRSPAPSEIEPGRAALRAADLEIEREGRAPSRWPMPQIIALVGSSSLCHLRLTGERATRFAFSLVRTPVGVWMVDLGSSSGVLVNGQQQPIAQLGEGDQIPVGPYRLVMRYGRDRQAPASPRAESRPVSVSPPTPVTTPATVRHRPPRTVSSLTAASPAPEELLPAVHGLLERVVQVQQQMSEQLPQAIAMITQAFGALQRDQMDVVRQELAEIRRLNQEILTLRSADRAPEAAPASRAAAPAPRLTPPRPDPDPRLAEDVPGEPSGPERPDAAAPGAEPAPLSPPPRFDPHVVGDFVGERLARVERERRSRWRKLLRAMLSS